MKVTRELFSRAVPKSGGAGETKMHSMGFHDPDGFAKLPAEMRKETQGPAPERTDRALKRAFGQGAAEMEALWRAWTLEIE